MDKNRILVVEDEEMIRSLIQLYLENRGFFVEVAEDGNVALQKMNTGSYDLVLLDIEMPNIDGFEVCQEIRRRLNVPIIFVTSRRNIDDKIKSFALGGDDYITKPFDFGELEARIHANIRRFEQTVGQEVEKDVLRLGNMEMYLDRLECYVKGNLLHLSARELELLILLVQHPQQVWSAERLYDSLWGMDSLGDAQTVKVHVSNIRKKIAEHDPDREYIETVRGFGYKYVPH